MQTDPELALYGRYVISQRLHEEGFEFQFPMLAEALDDLLERRAGPRLFVERTRRGARARLNAGRSVN